jgi:Zn-dependent protease
MREFFPTLYWSNLLIIPGLLIGYTVHELAHATAAYFLGDYSQVERGKFTLNPFEHISWFGFFAFLLFGMGWSKPLEASPQHLKRKHRDLCLIALAGPAASFTLSQVALLLTLSIAATLVYVSGASTDEIFTLIFPGINELPETLDLQAWLIALTSKLAIANFWLAVISILPFPGLDGFIIIVSLVAFLRMRRQLQQQQQGKLQGQPRPLTLINQYTLRNNISDIHFKAGTEYHEAQQYDDAIVRYRQAISNDQHFGPAYINLGLAYLGKGRRREAIHAFRGAIQYADEQKSRQEAWYQLHQLSGVTPLDESLARQSMAEIGATPWTDTKPRPNWIGLGIGGGLFLLTGVFVYTYLITQVIEMLRV